MKLRRQLAKAVQHRRDLLNNGSEQRNDLRAERNRKFLPRRLSGPDLVGRALRGSGDVALRFSRAGHDKRGARLDLRGFGKLAVDAFQPHLEGLRFNRPFVEVDVEPAHGLGFARQARLQGRHDILASHVVEAGEVLAKNGELLGELAGLLGSRAACFEQAVHGQHTGLHLGGRTAQRVAGRFGPRLGRLCHAAERHIEGRLHLGGVDGRFGHSRAEGDDGEGKTHRHVRPDAGKAVADFAHLAAKAMQALLGGVQAFLEGDGVGSEDYAERPDHGFHGRLL